MKSNSAPVVSHASIRGEEAVHEKRLPEVMSPVEDYPYASRDDGV
jgi:hypothetical protein